MKTIGELIELIEHREQATVLYIADYGSRSWGLDTNGSDQDLLVLYVKDLESNLSLWGFDDSFCLKGQVEGVRTEIACWELGKALILLSKSNAGLLEALSSPLVLYEKVSTLRQLRYYGERFYNPMRFKLSYASNARGALKDLLAHTHPPFKLYLKVLRPLLCAYFIQAFDHQPIPHNFDSIIERLKIDVQTASIIRQIVKNRTTDHDTLAARNEALPPINLGLVSWIQDVLQSVSSFTHADSTTEPLKVNKVALPSLDKLDAIYREEVLAHERARGRRVEIMGDSARGATEGLI